MEKWILKELMKYNKILNKLYCKKIINNAKLVAEIAEREACKKLRLTPKQRAGYDAIDSNGKKYEIKARKDYPWDENVTVTLTPSKIQMKEADYFVYVWFNQNWGLKYPIWHKPKTWIEMKKKNMKTKRIVLTKLDFEGKK